MNYFSFYNKAKELLIDSLASLWFKGQAQEQEYIKRILTKDEPLFAEPVFQSIFPWEESADSFEEHSSKLRLLTPSFVNALSSEGIDKDLRFPLDRHPYKHQTESWRTMLSSRPQTIVVTTGTGSGKTECFMIPVLQDLAKTNEKNCVQAIFLYPLNALMKSQQKRIHAWCKALPEKVTYAIYNGETDKENRSDRYTTSHYPQLVTRPQIRKTPPQILFTNPVISGKVERLQEPYLKLIKGTSLAQITLADVAQVVKKDIVAVYNVFDAHKGALAKAIESLKNESGTTNAIKAIEKQEENFFKTSMLSYLAENSFLPSAGLPLGLVECLLGGKEKVDGNSPTLHISQAISSYAPGNPVVKNEWVYETNGIRLKTKYDDSTSRYIIQNCTHCGYTTIIYGSAKTDCPKCGRHGTMHGIKDISLSTDQRFTEVVEPAAFSVAWDSTPTRKMDSLGSMNFIQPILLEMDAWLLKTNSAKMSIRCSTPRSEILFYNKGTNGYGYAFCPYCGRMKSEKSPDTTERMLSHHKHLLASTSCPGGENDGAAVRRHVLLVGRYQTDFVEIKFYDKDNNLVEDTETLYSLGVILSRKLTELLGVNDGEIEFGYDGINHSIFIYDTALGGAGYSLLFREYKDEVLKMALETLERCDCERSCTKCLIDRRSQWYTNYLNRPKALEWLRQEVKARVAPKEIIYLMPDSHVVTSDITTEFYQLTRNKDISGIRIFVNDNISQWDAETFPFKKILTELSLEGVDVAFILPSVPDVKSLSSADSATLIAEVFKTNFKCLENTLPTGLFPLMVVIMNDGIVKTYFGKNIDTSYSKNWGSGDVFITTQPNSLSYADINRMQLLSAFSSDDSSFMFEYRIREHSSLGRFFDSLKAPETGNWNRIISNLRGKAVSIEYSDRYLKTPLGCMLLAKMISSLKNEADLVLVSIKVIVTNIVSINDPDMAVNAIKDFTNGKKRNHFLKDAIFELTGIEPEIQDTGYVEHERCLTVKADNAEICIRPDAGIAKGWAPFGRDNAECTDRDFREDWNIDLELFNKQQIGNGILYTISYKQL